jgi:hypothetical protein
MANEMQGIPATPLSQAAEASAIPDFQIVSLAGLSIVVGVMAVIALGVLEPANLAVLFELKKPEPDGELIGKLMRRFVYTAGITGAMQVATLIIMTRLATW